MRLVLEDVMPYRFSDNVVGSGSEGIVYSYIDNKLIKMFYTCGRCNLERISDKGLEIMSTLPLKTFSKPIDIIYDDTGKVVGYTKENIEDQELDVNNIDYDQIYEDIRILSDNGFKIEDICYNYMYSNNNIHFIDISSFMYIEPRNEYIKKYCFKYNLEAINMFLVGLVEFDAYKKGEKSEFTKAYKSYVYLKTNHIKGYYGDYKKK